MSPCGIFSRNLSFDFHQGLISLQLAGKGGKVILSFVHHSIAAELNEILWKRFQDKAYLAGLIDDCPVHFGNIEVDHHVKDMLPNR